MSYTMMNSFGVSDFAGRVGDMVKRSITGETSSEDHDPPARPKAYRPRSLSVSLVNEEHFSGFEGTFSSCRSESELELAIEKCKQLILDSAEKSDMRYNLIRKLVELRWKLQELREGPQTPILDNSFTVMGHVFVSCNLDKAESYCERCCTRIWDLINIGPNQFYCCDKCHYKCHQKCLNSITRSCAYLKPHEYELDICPEVGLSSQNYKCQECRSTLVAGSRYLPSMETQRRLCDHCGHWFCSYCHWNTEVVVPARVLHNWDFTPKKVCRGCVQFLRLMAKRPVLDVQKINPFLFSHVEELAAIKFLREDLIQMKQYITSCHIAQSKKLLWLLKKRHHFVENSFIYSLQDLQDLEAGSLLKYVQQVSNVFENHITKECEGCRGKGFLCELCVSKDLLFPIHRDATSRCPDCLSVFHRDCYKTSCGCCPRCSRLNRRVDTLKE